MSKSSTPDSSNSDGTRGTITRISIGDTASPCGLNVSPYIGDIRESATLDLRKSNKLDTSIDQQFTNNMVAPPIFTELLWDKLSKSSSWVIYMHCWLNLAANPVNILVLKFVGLGLSNINALDKIASIWTPATRDGIPTYFSYWSVPGCKLWKNYSGWRRCERKVRL